MAIISKSDAVEISKEYYASGEFVNAGYKKNPAMALAKKKKITGKYYDFSMKYGQAPNRSRTAATALAKVNKTNFVEFNVPTRDSFDAKDIDQKAMKEVKDEGAFVDLLTSTMDDLAESLGNGLGEDLFLNTGGWIGQIGSGQGTPNVVLLNPSHVTRFYVGQVLRVSTADGNSGALKAGSVTVTAVDRDTGTVTASGNWTAGIGTAAANDYIFADGDFGLGRAGLPAWIPDTTANLGTAFYGATRSVDATRLAGCRQGVSFGADIVTSMRSLMARIAREEGDPDTAFCSFDTLADVESQVETKVIVDVKAKDVDMGFSGIKVVCNGKPVTFVPDRSCPDDRIWLGNTSKLELIHSQDEPFVLDDEDGELLSRNSGSFSYDIRGSAYANYVIRKPNDWGVLIFS